MKPSLILIAGLPATGKTTAAKKLGRSLEDYILIDQNELRREVGMKKMPQVQDSILHEIDVSTADYLRRSKGVIIESGHRYLFRRQQLCGIASSCNASVVLLECICSENESKKRMRNRSKGDGLISDPRDPGVYDRISGLWEPIDLDFRYPGVDYFISYLTYNTESSEIDEKKIVREDGDLILKVKEILLGK